MRLKKIYYLILSGILLVLLSGFFSGTDNTYFQIEKNIDLFGKVYKEVTFNYLDKVSPTQFMRAGIKGMLGSLDPYTVFMYGNMKKDIDLITKGKYGGVGISIGIRSGKITVIEVMDGYSAQKQGIRIGDVIIEAAGKKITPENIEQLPSLVKGKPGTMVNIKVLRNDEKDTLSFNLVREEIKVRSLSSYGFYPPNSHNVYMKLTNFSRSAADEVKNALQELSKKKKIKSIIFDLRGNPGGLLGVAVSISDKFLPPNDLVVTTKGRNPDNDKSYYSVQKPIVGKARLVVLINDGTASASEIFSGAMQDHDRGVILGTKSFGKGLVQTVIPLNYNSSLKITTAKYFTPSGRWIQKINYAENNKVITGVNNIIKKKYYTDHHRIVFSAGGITPDTVVLPYKKSAVTEDLLAKGLFFQFADHYYYLYPNRDFYKINDNRLFNDFVDYLKSNEYRYHSKVEKQVDQLIVEAQGNKLENNLLASLHQIKKQFELIGGSEIKIHKKEIIDEIKDELVSRYLGSTGKMKELLSNDDQFQTALKIVNDTTVYNKLLNLN